MIRTLGLAAAAGAVGFAAARGVSALRPALESRIPSLTRANHAGRRVSLLEGPAVAVGLTLAAAAVDAPRQRAAAVLAVAASGALGAVDDFAETGASKGLRGHLGALRRGELTTGALKVLGIPAASVAACALIRDDADALPGRALDAVLAGGVVAGTANLLNLLDLRPGRALKAAGAVLALSAPPPALPHRDDRASAVLAAGIIGAGAAVLGDDLRGESMLGDTGANALGAALGMRTALTASRGELAAVLAVLAALTLLSEKVSFTRIIEATPVLRELDAAGR